MHAYLITGGGQEEQENWIKTFLVREQTEKQNLIRLAPFEGKHLIGDIRALTKQLSVSFGGKNRVIIVENAELLTLEAANAFLKLLEEPPQNTSLLLTAPNQESVLETISSRTSLVSLGNFSINLTEEQKLGAKKILRQILKIPIGERFQIGEKLGSKEEACAFCEEQIIASRDLLLAVVNKSVTGISQEQVTKLIEGLSIALQDILANVNVKLVIADLMINYPQAILKK